MNQSRSVRVITSDELNTKNERFRRDSTVRAEEWKFLRGVKMLKSAHERGDAHAAREAYEMLGPYLYGPPKSPEHAAAIELSVNYSSPERPLAALITKALRDVRIVYWNVGKGKNVVVTPGIYCPDYKAAVTTKYILETDFRVCPRCHKPFVAKRPKQHCCSIECREAHRVARWRQKQRRED
jgi:hypothetical protein